MPATTITITLSEDGKFSCAGPLDNKVLCYGLLELAKESVAKHTQRVKLPTDDEVTKLTLS